MALYRCSNGSSGGGSTINPTTIANGNMGTGGGYGSTSWKPKKTFTNLTVGKTYMFPFTFYGGFLSDSFTKEDFAPSTGIDILNVVSYWSGVYSAYYDSIVIIFKATSTTAEIELTSTLTSTATWLLGDGLVQLD